jgi:hypothetical protein
MSGAPAFPRQGRLSAIQQLPRLKLADRIAALAALKLGQVDAGLGTNPACILGLTDDPRVQASTGA